MDFSKHLYEKSKDINLSLFNKYTTAADGDVLRRGTNQAYQQQQ